MREFDYLIIGQGLAGTTLAWQLQWLGKSVAVIDREAGSTASKVASGLISPITGKRNAVSWRFDQLWPVAKQFYERVELATHEQFFRCQSLLRILRDGDQIDTRTYVGHRSQLTKPLNSKLEAIELAPTARLDVTSYLDASRVVFDRHDAYFTGDIDPSIDLKLEDDRVQVPRLAIGSRRLIFCQGIDAQSNGWFPDVEFEAAKGEILTIELPDVSEQRIVHGDVWLAPTEAGRADVGSTYDRNFEDAQPTPEGREEILRKLSVFAPGEYQVVDHRAAIRPIVRGRLPVVGVHASLPLGYFNGLGSKGCLRAPFVAWQFAEFLVNGNGILDEIRLDAPDKPTTPRRLTELAHRRVASVLHDGAIAIDATAGNGFDTVFLASTAGDGGHVFAIDMQNAAIVRTQARLAADGITNVTLRLGSHAQLVGLIPNAYHGRVSAIMFNLGYLPRGDKAFTTKTESTVAAITSGLELLASGGVMTVLAYTGHPGGLDETLAVEKTFSDLDSALFEVELPATPPEAGPPRLYVAKRRG